MTDNIIKNLSVRELAPQRTISLYKDQEDLIAKIIEEHDLNIKMASLVREGVDIALEQITAQLKKNSK